MRRRNPNTETQPAVAAILLAAGQGKRFGRAKALLEISGRLAVHCVFDKLLEAGYDPVITVLNPEVNAVLVHSDDGLDRFNRFGKIVVNPQPELGTLHSIRLGVQSLPHDSAAALFMPVDHPFVSVETLKKLHDAARPETILIPVCNGKRGHPPVFGRDHLPALHVIPLDDGARGVIHRLPEKVVELETGDDGVLRNINTATDREGYPVQSR